MILIAEAGECLPAGMFIILFLSHSITFFLTLYVSIFYKILRNIKMILEDKKQSLL